MPRGSIRRRFINSFIGLAIGPLLLVAILVGLFAYRDHITTATTHQNEVARRVAIEAVSFLQHMEHDLQQLSDYYNVAAMDQSEQRQLLAVLLKRTELFHEISLLDAQGRERQRLSTTRLITPDDLRSLSDTPEFNYCRENLSFSAGRVFFDEETGEPLITLAYPLIDRRSGTFVGALMATGQFKVIWNMLMQAERSEADDVYILDEENRIVAHRNPSQVLKGSVVELQGDSTIQPGISGEMVVIGTHVMRFGQQRFTVVAERLSAAALAPAERSVKLTLLVIIIALLGASALIVYSIRHIIGPIQSIAAAVNEMRDGNLQHRVAISARDEIGSLADAVNQMAYSLNESITSLGDSEERYRLMVENQNDLIVKFDAEHRLQFVSPTYCDTFGKRAEELLGHHFFPLVHEEDRERVKASLASLEHPPHTTSHEERALTVDGWRWFSWSARAMVDERGEIKAIISVGRDITERKQAESRLQDSEEQIRLLLDSVGEGVFGIDGDGICTFVNDASLKLLGYSRADELIGKNLHDLVHHTHTNGTPYNEVECPIYNSFRDNQPSHVEGEYFWRKDGSHFLCEYGSYPLHKGNETVGCVVVFSDITEEHRTREKLRLSSKIIENAQEGILITTPDATIIDVNHAFEEITGYSREEAIGATPRINKSGRHDKAFYEEMWRQLTSKGEWHGEIWDRRKSGEVYPKLLSINAVVNEQGETSHYVGIFADITKQKQTEEALQKLAYYDHLTDLPNRTLFRERLNQVLAIAARQQSSVALLFIDLDRFKYVNDTLGHAAGDELLEHISRRLLEQTRHSDTVSRLGGDEFTVILSDISNPDDVAQIAQKLVETLKEPVEIMGHEVRVGGSIGIALYPEDGSDAETLTKHADTAMYQAKDSGRNNYQFFTPQMNRHVAERLVIEGELHRALENEEFVLHYQPKLDLSSGKIIGMEALVRWQHQEMGMVSPAKFIPLAEETGLIIPLGNWILEVACRQVVEWSRTAGRRLKLAVNLSARQFHQPDLTAEIKRVIDTTGIEPSSLELEITESILMGDIDEAIAVMGQIRALGVELAIDDFGTGFSSLNYLKRFPINTLKVDQSFVRDLAVDSEDAAIVKSVITLGHSLGLTVVAEGVETAEQMAFLQKERCDLAQGYHISRPLSVTDFEQRIIKGDG